MLSSLNKFQMSCKCPSKNDCERWGSAAQRTCIAQSKLDSLAQPSLMAARYVTWVKAHVERLKSMRSEFYSMDIDNNARTTKRDPRNTSGLGRSKLRSYFSSFGTKVQTQYACAGDCSFINDIFFVREIFAIKYATNFDVLGPILGSGSQITDLIS